MSFALIRAQYKGDKTQYPIIETVILDNHDLDDPRDQEMAALKIAKVRKNILGEVATPEDIEEAELGE